MGRERILRERVNRLRELMQEAGTAPESTASPPADASTHTEAADAWRRYAVFAANDPLPAHDDSEEAIAIRTINRIAVTYGWSAEVQRFLDRHRASSLTVLDDAQLSELSQHMLHLEECAHHGYSPPDCPAAF